LSHSLLGIVDLEEEEWVVIKVLWVEQKILLKK
jgi:hypothetical protein